MKLRNLRTFRKTADGFSIIEAVIGMAVFGITAIALYGGLMSGFSTVRMARENQRATQIILDTMEMVRLYSWDQLTTTGFVPTTFVLVDDGLSGGAPTNRTWSDGRERPTGTTYTGRITLSDPTLFTNYDSRLKLVRVELTWMTGGLQRTRQLSTLVTSDGLYSYIY